MPTARRPSPGRAARPRPKGDAGPRWERRLVRRGYRGIAGVDEVGRGCWAGPLIAAAVILPPPTRALTATLSGLRDSKQLSPARREHFYGLIGASARAIGLGHVTAATIDQLGLGPAGRLALERAVLALSIRPDYLLVDAFALPGVDCAQEAIIFGDALCLSIAAASVIAKVERDRLLDDLARRHPGFGFERNKGYGTVEHQRALVERGPTAHHRATYAPVRAAVEARWLC